MEVVAMKKIKTRELTDTSWLAQSIKDRMDVEFDNNGASARYNCLNTLHIIVNEADDPNNENIYYSNGRKEIIIRDIPSLALEHGLDFNREGMQNKLRGLAERYTDDDGQYLVSVMTTHDLNSAKIKDISELMFQMID
jgi:hypothetical protein